MILVKHLDLFKIALNTPLAQRKPGWIDFNAGRLLEGAAAELTRALLDHVLAIASGSQQVRNEINGFREIAIFKDGVTL